MEASTNDILLTVLQSILYIKLEVHFLLLDLFGRSVAQIEGKNSFWYADVGPSTLVESKSHGPRMSSAHPHRGENASQNCAFCISE